MYATSPETDVRRMLYSPGSASAATATLKLRTCVAPSVNCAPLSGSTVMNGELTLMPSAAI